LIAGIFWTEKIKVEISRHSHDAVNVAKQSYAYL